MQAAVPAAHCHLLREQHNDLPLGVVVFANQHVHTGQTSYVQKNHWPKFGRTEPADDPERYKIALQFQNLLLLVAHWSRPARHVLAAGIHIPAWPIEQFYPSYYASVDVPRPYDSRTLLLRFSDTLALLQPDGL